MKSLAPLMTVACVAALALLAGCASTEAHHHGHSLGDHARAVCVMTPTEGNACQGVIRYEQRGGKVHITADVSGLQPNSRHAWHIHEYGDLTSADGTATGGHYNPEGHDHGLPEQAKRHAGDFGNLTADAGGRARAELTVDNITIAGKHNPIIGRAMIIHAKPDDGGQPTGNAGARIAQGVIGIAAEG